MNSSKGCMKEKHEQWMSQAKVVKQAAVLGAGVMGGGIAYQSALHGVPILMKDIQGEPLHFGCQAVISLLDRQIKKGQLTEQKKQQVIDHISPALDFQGFAGVDLLIEAVTENPMIKAKVLQEVESIVPEDAVLTSNTSTISIDTLAQGLARPEKFCGMHFFNPVPLMPLVEVVRGTQTNDQAIARTVAYAHTMGKTPIVVNDCPGFLVNRVLFPYFNGFNRLLMDGVDFQRIDQVMETFGWPMGPAYLADAIGLDTMVHADKVMQIGFPERMSHDAETIIEALLDRDCLGQKNGTGFYEYGKDEQGRCIQTPSEMALALIQERLSGVMEVSDQDIIDRMMIPMCLEAVLCLEDGIVEASSEVDMGLVLGLGFPQFRGGALHYIDCLGLRAFAASIEANAHHGPLYQLSEGFKNRVERNQVFYD